MLIYVTGLVLVLFLQELYKKMKCGCLSFLCLGVAETDC